MTTKDLNLSLDRGLLQPKVAHNRNSAAPFAQPGAAQRDTRPTSRSTTRRPARQALSSWHVTAVSGVAIANMLFLVLAGLWLSGHTDRTPTQLADSRLDIAPQLRAMEAGIDVRISSLEQQLENLEVTINAQWQLVATARQDIAGARPQGDSQQALSAEATSTGATPGEVAQTIDPAQQSKDWHVSLGSFSEKNSAASVQGQLQALGYEAQIQSLNIDNTMTHRVILPAFENQKSAEVAATMLMAQTQLDTVSVWQGD